jgi:hypothetical protein
MTKQLTLIALLCIVGCTPVTKVTSNEYFIQENGANYIGSIVVADMFLEGTCRAYLPNYKKDWPDVNQAMYEFKNVLTSEYIANRPYVQRKLIEQQVVQEIFNGQFEKSLNKIKAQFVIKDRSREECIIQYQDISLHLATLQWQWNLFKDNSYWGEAMANYKKGILKANATNLRVPNENIVPQLTFDQLQEGFQRIDYFRIQRENGVITQQEFELRRSRIINNLY